MATGPKVPFPQLDAPIKCPYPAVKEYLREFYVADGELAEGFTNVYKTGTPGVGVRFIISLNWSPEKSLPLTHKHPNHQATASGVVRTIQLEFIRTARDVGQGATAMHFRIEQDINGWNAAQIIVNGSTKLETRSYFAGCAGVEKLNIPLGKVSIADIGKQQKHFNLDVLCSGMPAGTKLPVRLYFAGNSSGPGRLNLDVGGAQGVEIALTNSKGVRLPFAKSSALDMDWINTQPGGELYRLAISAGYARKGTEKVEVGQANGTLNYILEYN